MPEGTSGLELSLIYLAGVATLAQGHRALGRPYSAGDTAARKGPVPTGTVQCSRESDLDGVLFPHFRLCDLGHL